MSDEQKQSIPIRLGSLNYVVLLGRLTMDPDLRYTQGGSPVVNFRVAVDRAWKDKGSDEWRREASFFNVNLWGSAAERFNERARKGSPVLVEGQLRSRSWEAQDGQKRYTVEVWATRVQELTKAEHGSLPERTPGPGTPDDMPHSDEPPPAEPPPDDIPF